MSTREHPIFHKLIAHGWTLADDCHIILRACLVYVRERHAVSLATPRVWWTNRLPHSSQALTCILYLANYGNNWACYNYGKHRLDVWRHATVVRRASPYFGHEPNTPLQYVSHSWCRMTAQQHPFCGSGLPAVILELLRLSPDAAHSQSKQCIASLCSKNI